MRDLNKYVAECIQELATYGIEVPDGINYVVNTRSKRRYGQCKSINGKAYEINIGSFLLDESILKDDHGLRDTIIHEMLHACSPGSGHKGKWKQLANRVNIKSGGKYDIARTTSYEDMGINEVKIQRKINYKYVLVCDECGHKYKHQRRTKSVQHPERYRCGYCNGNLSLVTL